MWRLLIKGAGAALVVCAGGMLGWRRGNAAMRRVRMLEEGCAFLGALWDELHFRGGRTEEILASAQSNAHLAVLPLYFTALSSGCALQTERREALRRTERELAGILSSEERELLCGALENLGACPAREEEQRIAHARARLAAAWESAHAQAQQQRKLYRTIGLSLGGAAALLLL